MIIRLIWDDILNRHNTFQENSNIEHRIEQDECLLFNFDISKVLSEKNIQDINLRRGGSLGSWKHPEIDMDEEFIKELSLDVKDTIIMFSDNLYDDDSSSRVFYAYRNGELLIRSRQSNSILSTDNMRNLANFTENLNEAEFLMLGMP